MSVRVVAFSILALSLLASPSSVSAAGGGDPTTPKSNPWTWVQNFFKAREGAPGPNTPASYNGKPLKNRSLPMVFRMTSFTGAGVQFLNDVVADRIEGGRQRRTIGIDRPISLLLQSLVSDRGKQYLIQGPSGLGKTALVDEIARMIVTEEFEEGVVKNALTRTYLFRTTPSLMRDEAVGTGKKTEDHFRELIRACSRIESSGGVRPVLIIDEISSLTGSEAAAIESAIKEVSTPPRVILVGNDVSAFEHRPNVRNMGGVTPSGALLKVLQVIPLEDPTPFQKLQIITDRFIVPIQVKYNVIIPREVVELAIARAGVYFSGQAGVGGAVELLEKAALLANLPAVRSGNTEAVRLSVIDFNLHFPASTGGAGFSEDPATFRAQISTLKERVKTRMFGQDPMIDAIIDQWAAGQQSSVEKPTVVSVMGTTGVGKTSVGELIGEEQFGDAGRVFTIDMLRYQGENKHRIIELFGAPTSYTGSDSKGKLCTWIESLGGQAGIVVINELDKASSESFQKLSEMLEKGTVGCNDGDKNIGKTLILLTSNKSVKSLVPDDFLRRATCEEIDKKVAAITEEQMINAFTTGESKENKGKNIESELLMRIDRFIFASPICKERAVTAIQASLNKFSLKDFERRGKGQLKFADTFVGTWLDLAYDPVYGIRPIEKRVRTEVQKLYDQFAAKYPPAGFEKTEISYSIERNPVQPYLSTVTLTDENGNRMEFKGPQSKSTSALFDPEERAKLSSLESTISKRVRGQPEMVKAFSDMVRAKKVNPNAKSPKSTFIIGPTGIGKSETAYVGAETVYGSRDDVFTLDMSAFTEGWQFEQYINPDRDIGLFEQFLRKHPEGGILLWDEMSNAGGMSRERRYEISTKFYKILEKGVFVSNATGETYDLRKYEIEFTGNTGQEYFFGLNTDDELRSTWERVGKSPAKCRQMLRDAGFAPAFVGRLTDCVFGRPLLSGDKLEITKSIYEVWLEQFKKSLPVLTIEAAPGFLEKISQLTFSPSEGARSIENFFTKTASNAIESAMGKADYDKLREAGQNPIITLDIESQSPTEPFYREAPSAKTANLIVKGVQGLGSKNPTTFADEKIDFKSEANFMKQVSIADAISLMVHEAGHAVVNDPLVTSRILTFLTVVPAPDNSKIQYLGYASYTEMKERRAFFNENDLIDYGAMLFAGTTAQQMIGDTVDTGRAEDLKDFRGVVFRMGVQGGLKPELIGIQVDKEGNPILTPEQAIIYTAYINEIMEKSIARAKEQLTARWPLLMATVKALYKNEGRIFGTEFYELEKKFNALTADAKAKAIAKGTPAKLQKIYRAVRTRCDLSLRKRFDPTLEQD